MMDTKHLACSAPLERKLIRLYWAMRLSMAMIWLWTAIVCWFFYPPSESLAWLRRIGLGEHADWCLVSACVLDFAMGLASLCFARPRLWQLQFAIVMFYTLVISIGLPEFLLHPFGPISKNLAVLAVLAYLNLLEKR